jgi:hypothetical protein
MVMSLLIYPTGSGGHFLTALCDNFKIPHTVTKDNEWIIDQASVLSVSHLYIQCFPLSKFRQFLDSIDNVLVMDIGSYQYYVEELTDIKRGKHSPSNWIMPPVNSRRISRLVSRENRRHYIAFYNRLQRLGKRVILVNYKNLIINQQHNEIQKFFDFVHLNVDDFGGIDAVASLIKAYHDSNTNVMKNNGAINCLKN